MIICPILTGHLSGVSVQRQVLTENGRLRKIQNEHKKLGIIYTIGIKIYCRLVSNDIVYVSKSKKDYFTSAINAMIPIRQGLHK